MKSYFTRGKRVRRNPDDIAHSRPVIVADADAACNARQSASIIMTIEHNKSRGFASERERNRKEREKENRYEGGLRSREGLASADGGRCNMRASIRVNKCLYPVFLYTVTPDEP